MSHQPAIAVQTFRRDSTESASPSAAPYSAAGRVPGSTLRSEFDIICQRLAEPEARRAALTEVLLRQRRIMGIAWYRVDASVAEPMLVRLPNPAVERAPIREWLALLAAKVPRPGGTCEESSPDVRNLTALAAALPAAGGLAETLVVLVAGAQQSRCTEEWLMLLQLQLALDSAHWQSRTRQAETQTQLAAALLDLTSRINSAPALSAAGHELVRSLREHFDCSLVAVGLGSPHASGPRLFAVSDGVESDPYGPAAQRIEAALAEAMLANRVIVFPNSGTIETSPALGHKRLTAVLGTEMTVSTPLLDSQGAALGAVLCAGSARTLGSCELSTFLSAAAQPLGLAIEAARQREGGWLGRWGRRFASITTIGRAALAAAGLAAIVGVLTIPLPYRISAGCRLEPFVRRMTPAPFDGLLQSTSAAPGDLVTAGQVLATMDGREIRWELAGVVADQERAAKERDALLAAQEIAKSYLAELEGERLAARGTLLRDRLERLEIRSPIDGVILSGSLDRRENVPVSVGQSLYEVAPLESLRVEVEVPAIEISHVRAGMQVEVQMDGVVDEPVSGVIERIRPSSEVREGRNVFVAEVTLDNRSGRLRPGMEGTVRIIGDIHPLGWNLFHRAWDYVRSRVW